MKIELEKYRDSAGFRFLDWQFGEMLVRRAKDLPEQYRDAVLLLGAKCLSAAEQGHSCLDLAAWSEPVPDDCEDAQPPSPLTPEEWTGILDSVPSVVCPLTGPTEPVADYRPLRFDREHGLVYLQKYHQSELRVAAFVRNRIGKPSKALPPELMQNIHDLNRLFASKPAGYDDPQQAAVAMAYSRDFSILTGGPGTGKTTVLSTILALELLRDPQLRIGLAAPTGKAARQMLDSLQEERTFHLDREKIGFIDSRLAELTCSTVHRMLGIKGAGRRPEFDQDSPLPYDLIVIDECSMISLRLMDMLFAAIRPDCRLLLIGDRNQLPAVETGSLLGDFCTKCACLKTPPGTPPDQVFITKLTENHRADANPALKDLIRVMDPDGGEPDSAQVKERTDLLYAGTDPLFRAEELPGDPEQKKSERERTIRQKLAGAVNGMFSGQELPASFAGFFGNDAVGGIRPGLEHWRKLDSGKGIPDLNDKPQLLPLALAHFYAERFRIICAVHDGPFGERSLNRQMVELLGRKLYDDGVPVIILQNDPRLGLNNGDIGICWGGKVCFPQWRDNSAGIRIFDCARVYGRQQLPDHTAAYAMTIHKSQGSGFDNVLMVLPERDNAVLSRELIYTGISRTRKNFLLWSPRDIFETAIGRETARWSGMQYQLP